MAEKSEAEVERLRSSVAAQPDEIHFTRGDYGAAREVAEADRYFDAVGVPATSPTGEIYSVCGRILRHQAIYTERLKELEARVGESQLTPTTECPDGEKHILRCIRCEVPA